MQSAIWAILREGNRFLLIQQADGTWAFPDDKIENTVGLLVIKPRRLFQTHLDGQDVQVFVCHKWFGELSLTPLDAIGLGWFTLPEIYTIERSLSPLTNYVLLYFAYLIQHYDMNPDAWEKLERLGD